MARMQPGPSQAATCPSTLGTAPLNAFDRSDSLTSSPPLTWAAAMLTQAAGLESQGVLIAADRRRTEAGYDWSLATHGLARAHRVPPHDMACILAAAASRLLPRRWLVDASADGAYVNLRIDRTSFVQHVLQEVGQNRSSNQPGYPALAMAWIRRQDDAQDLLAHLRPGWPGPVRLHGGEDLYDQTVEQLKQCGLAQGDRSGLTRCMWTGPPGQRVLLADPEGRPTELMHLLTLVMGVERPNHLLIAHDADQRPLVDQALSIAKDAGITHIPDVVLSELSADWAQVRATTAALAHLGASHDAPNRVDTSSLANSYDFAQLVAQVPEAQARLAQTGSLRRLRGLLVGLERVVREFDPDLRPAAAALALRALGPAAAS